MPSASATKASDKAQACKTITTILQKEYGKAVPKLKLPVLETMLFAVCLEDNPWDRAEAGYERLMKSYFDLNEVRVSSVSELERTLEDLNSANWKGLRIRSILRFVFESTYSFDFEKLAKLTLESAQKRLKKIDYLSPFITNFTLQQVLSSHVVCLDDYSHRAAIHLGLVPPDSNLDDASEFLKPGLKKSETFAFSHLLRCLATDPKYVARFADPYEAEDEFDILKVAERLAVVKAPKKKSKARPPKPVAAKEEKPAAKATAKASTPAVRTSGKASTKAPAAQSKASATRPASSKGTVSAPASASKKGTKAAKKKK